jgi:sugar phosphate isomerase/epimerase
MRGLQDIRAPPGDLRIQVETACCLWYKNGDPMFFMNSQISRRSFLGTAMTAGAVAVGGAFGARDLLAAEDYGGKKLPIGLQLYTIGGDLKKDAAGSLAKVAQCGYKGVEFAGFPSNDAKEVRKMLDDNGLKCCGSHTGMSALQGDGFAKTVEFAKTIGNTRLISPSLFRNFSNDAEKDRKMVEDAADQMNALAEKLKPEGMRIGFHCHPGEFRKIGDSTVWDIFFTRARKDVIMQCDLGHMGTAGVDPVAYMARYPGRADTVHVKPSAKKNRGGLLGDTDDDLNWPAIFHACETVGGTEWYIVEYDGGSMEKAEKTMELLKKWGKA